MADSLHSNFEVGQKVSFGGFSIRDIQLPLGVILCNSYYWYGVLPKNESEDVVSEEVEAGDVKWLAGISISIASVCNFNSIAYICPTFSSSSNDKARHWVMSSGPRTKAEFNKPCEEVEVGIEPHRAKRCQQEEAPRHFPVSLVETVFHEPSLGVPNSPYKLPFLNNIRNKNSIRFHYHQMRTLLSRLIHSTPSISRLNGRNLCTDSNKVDEPFKTEEAETVNVPPPPTEKLLVLGGNGFVGSHICREALERGLSVASISRFDVFSHWTKLGCSYVGVLGLAGHPYMIPGLAMLLGIKISCVGGFGSNSYMYKINGTANINAIRAASDQGN
ncbi:hypothetical protein V8G54_008649 [Vigna mungo]|uniref:NAD-dependent epimerase/dehydratase domain-containing protein n=1 Tax=Vigna mungo TaxID=3915 RepID=A0AAQ3P5Z5_VIGMU